MPKANWRKDKVTPEMVAAIGPPRSGERLGQYWLRWNRHCEQESQRKLSEGLARLRGEDSV